MPPRCPRFTMLRRGVSRFRDLPIVITDRLSEGLAKRRASMIWSRGTPRQDRWWHKEGGWVRLFFALYVQGTLLISYWCRNQTLTCKAKRRWLAKTCEQFVFASHRGTVVEIHFGNMLFTRSNFLEERWLKSGVLEYGLRWNFEEKCIHSTTVFLEKIRIKIYFNSIQLPSKYWRVVFSFLICTYLKYLNRSFVYGMISNRFTVMLCSNQGKLK